ncbi:MAG TPA: glycosyl hydrolase family 18 protein, partial [Terriglobales bacterium]|nr:glycosyl hydrolase family 18 protein [Terriglobales bacterium]
MAQPVFYDPRRSRWKRLRTLLDAVGILLSIVIVVFIYSALRSEPLPKLLLQFQKHPYHALKETEKERAKERRRQSLHRTHRRTTAAPSQVELNANEGIRGAFFVPWDAASFSSLREYARQIDLLYPEWLHVLTPDGHLQSVDEQTNKPFDVVQNSIVRSVDDKVMKFLKSEETGTEVFPLVNNFNGTNWVDISGFLNDASARSRFRREIAAFLGTDRYRGLMVDFEDFPPGAQPGFVLLLDELSQDLHAKGLKLYVSVPAGNSEFDYRSVANAADGVVLMNYDEHYAGTGGSAGPVASQDWFANNLAQAKKVVPLDKLICAIANYGYDWERRPKKGKTPASDIGHAVSAQEAWLAARDSEADVVFDGDSLNPHIT